MLEVVKGYIMKRTSDERWSYEDNIGHETWDYSGFEWDHKQTNSKYERLGLVTPR
jgi:hypothetical protein